MAQYLAEQIRNVALTGHASGGKTSLAEALLFKIGEIDRLGTIADGNTALDFDPEEIRRKTSISSSLYHFAWKGSKINLLDTPGLFDFSGGMFEGIRAAETVVIAVSARSGVSVGTQKAFKAAKKENKSCAIFVSKMDRDSADFYKVLSEMQSAFGTAVCPVVVPYMEDTKVAAYASLLTGKAYTYEKGVAKEIPMPAIDGYDDMVAALSEQIAEADEDLMEKFFSGEEFTQEELANGLRSAIESGAVVPVFCGDSVGMDAVDLFLDVMATSFPTAKDSASETAFNEKDEPVAIACSEEDPLAAYVFKTVADPFVGKLSFVKVISGKLSSDSLPVNQRTGQSERLGKLIFVKGKKQEETAVIGAGDIGAITKLTSAKTGDSLCDAKRVVRFAGVSYAAPTLSMAVKVKNKGDEGKIAQGMLRLIEEDPSIAFVQNNETHQQVVSGLGEQHIDVLISKLKAKFGVSVDLIEPRVPYRETIRKKVKVEGKHKKQTGGHGQFGHVWIEFEPYEGQELLFETNVFGGSVPKNYFPAVEKGLQDVISQGVIAGYPVVGLKATLLDGSYHPVDSSEMAFKLAAGLAYKAGVAQAGPVLLEPIGNLKVLVPDSATGDIMGELNKRRGRVLGMNPAEDGYTEVEGEVPMSEMHDYTTYLRSATQGQGSFVFEFVRYDQLPANLEDAVKAAAAKMQEEMA